MEINTDRDGKRPRETRLKNSRPVSVNIQFQFMHTSQLTGKSPKEKALEKFLKDSYQQAFIIQVEHGIGTNQKGKQYSIAQTTDNTDRDGRGPRE